MTKDFKFDPSVMPFYPSRNNSSKNLSNFSDKEFYNELNIEWKNLRQSSETHLTDQSPLSSDIQGDYNEVNLYQSLMTSPNIKNIWSRHAPDFTEDASSTHHSFNYNPRISTKYQSISTPKSVNENNSVFTTNSHTLDPPFSDESPLDTMTQDHVWTSLCGNEDRSASPGGKSDHNSTSYGSLQKNSFLSDMLFTRSDSDHKIDDLPNICCHNRVYGTCPNCCTSIPDCENTRTFHDAGYYSPFSTGMNLAFGSDDDDDYSRNQSSYRSLFASSTKSSAKNLFDGDKEKNSEAICDDVFLNDGNFLRGFDEIDEKSHMRTWLGLPPAISPVSKPTSKDIDLKDLIKNKSQNFTNLDFQPNMNINNSSSIYNKLPLNPNHSGAPNIFAPFTHKTFSRSMARDLMRLPPQIRQQYLEAALLDMESKCSLMSFDNSQSKSPGLDFNAGSFYNLPLHDNSCFQMANNWQFGHNISGIQQVPGPANKNLPLFLRPNVFPGHPSNHQLSQQMFGFPLSGYRPIRRSGPSNELHIKLEECYEQFKNIENERKRTEAELAKQNPGKNVSSDNNKIIPAQLSQNPSRVDRLVVETMREHSRVEMLMSKMELLRSMSIPQSIYLTLSEWFNAACNVHSCRKDEIINAINRHQIKNPQQQKEKDVLALACSLEELSKKTRKARTALWMALQKASFDLPEACIKAAYSMAARELFVDQSSSVNDEMNTQTVEQMGTKETGNDEDSDWFE